MKEKVALCSLQCAFTNAFVQITEAKKFNDKNQCFARIATDKSSNSSINKSNNATSGKLAGKSLTNIEHLILKNSGFFWVSCYKVSI
jgi:hypothetical protein